MLRHVIYFFLFLSTFSLTKAEDHTTWGLQHQEQSQALIKSYEKEALDLKNQAPSTFIGKGCSHQSNAPCANKQELKQPIGINKTNSDGIVYIFVSFSMPKESLKALALEAKKHKAVLVIRGLIENSFLKTASFLKDFGEGIVLDPLLFKEHKITVVPTFVEKHHAGFNKISGNITLTYALSKFKKGGIE